MPDSMLSHPVGDAKASSPGPFILPATTYQPEKQPSSEPVPLLDSTPVLRAKSRSPRFHEHISELADTSSPPPPLTPGVSKKRWGSVLYADSNPPNYDSTQANPAVSGDEGRMEEARRRQHQLHLMGYNNQVESQAAVSQGNGAGGQEKARPAERGPGRGFERKESQVSPDQTDSPVDSRFMISPFGTLAGNKRR
jgi:hypothetical protein